MTELRIGVVGSGGRGRWLGKLAHASKQKARVVACCDIVPSTLRENRHEYGAKILTTSAYRELLKCDLDAVIISTPDFCHEEQAVAALKRGLAVYLEKPMAITTTGCDRILRVAAETKSRLYLGHNLRHAPFALKIRELIKDGAIGEVKACWVRHFVGNGGDYYFRDWHAERRYSHGLLLQKATHDLDLIHWFCGGYSREVVAMGGLTVYGDTGKRARPVTGPRPISGPQLTPEVWPASKQTRLNHHIDVEDLSQVLLRLENGVFAQYSQCHFTPDYWRNYTIIGTEGRIENFGDFGTTATVRLWRKRYPHYNEHGDANFTFKSSSQHHGGADQKVIEEFLRYAREGGETLTSPIAARESVAAGYAATESLRRGGTKQTVPPPPKIVH